MFTVIKCILNVQVDGETNEEFTFAQLRDTCAAVAVRLQRRDFNLQPGNVIAISLPNCPQYVQSALGTIEAGFIVSPLNPLLSSGKENGLNYNLPN